MGKVRLLHAIATTSMVISVKVPSIKIPVFLTSVGQREIGTACRIIILISLYYIELKVF